MDQRKLDDLITQIENHLECWKQFNQCIAMARSKKFSQEDETQFLDLKSVLTQELEIILSSVESGSPTKEDVIELVTGTPSMRFLSEQNESSLRNIENQWHKIFIGWQSILGQLKVQQRQTAKKSFWGGLFGGNR